MPAWVESYFRTSDVGLRIEFISCTVSNREGAGIAIKISYRLRGSSVVEEVMVDRAEELVDSIGNPGWEESLASLLVEDIYEDHFALQQ
jgi:hypothetical protein